MFTDVGFTTIESHIDCGTPPRVDRDRELIEARRRRRPRAAERLLDVSTMGIAWFLSPSSPGVLLVQPRHVIPVDVLHERVDVLGGGRPVIHVV